MLVHLGVGFVFPAIRARIETKLRAKNWEPYLVSLNGSVSDGKSSAHNYAEAIARTQT